MQEWIDLMNWCRDQGLTPAQIRQILEEWKAAHP